MRFLYIIKKLFNNDFEMIYDVCWFDLLFYFLRFSVLKRMNFICLIRSVEIVLFIKILNIIYNIDICSFCKLGNKI